MCKTETIYKIEIPFRGQEDMHRTTYMRVVWFHLEHFNSPMISMVLFLQTVMHNIFEITYQKCLKASHVLHFCDNKLNYQWIFNQKMYVLLIFFYVSSQNNYVKSYVHFIFTELIICTIENNFIDNIKVICIVGISISVLK